jgi:hypothetical protein
MKQKINFIYKCGPIDHWVKWNGFIKNPGSWQQYYNELETNFKTKSIPVNLFEEFLHFVAKVSKVDHEWDGNFRDAFNMGYIITKDLFILGLKQNSNGTTIIGSNKPLIPSDFKEILDEPADAHSIELLYAENDVTPVGFTPQIYDPSEDNTWNGVYNSYEEMVGAELIRIHEKDNDSF